MSSREEEERIVDMMRPIMLGKLRANATKLHWAYNIKTADQRLARIKEFMDLLKGEIKELEDEIERSHADRFGLARAPKIRAEIADCMNILAMIADLAGQDTGDAP